MAVIRGQLTEWCDPNRRVNTLRSKSTSTYRYSTYVYGLKTNDLAKHNLYLPCVLLFDTLRSLWFSDRDCSYIVSKAWSLGSWIRRWEIGYTYCVKYSTYSTPYKYRTSTNICTFRMFRHLLNTRLIHLQTARSNAILTYQPSRALVTNQGSVRPTRAQPIHMTYCVPSTTTNMQMQLARYPCSRIQHVVTDTICTDGNGTSSVHYTCIVCTCAYWTHSFAYL